MSELKHFLENGGFSDISLDLNNYDVDTSSLTLVDSVDYLYTGLYKTFKNLYVGINSNTVAGVLAYEYYNGTTWTSLKVKDESRNFSRSGFLSWDIPSDWAKTDVNGDSLFYVRLTGTIEVVLSGLNMILANDNDLKEHYRQIEDYLGADSSYIPLHQACKKDIIQRIRNSGKVKVSSISCALTDLTIWDFMEPGQLRNAAAYLCLSKIFAGVSDNSDGKYFQLSRTFRKEYKTAMDTFLLSLDFNDSGDKDTDEHSDSVNITRVVTL